MKKGKKKKNVIYVYKYTRCLIETITVLRLKIFFIIIAVKYFSNGCNGDNGGGGVVVKREVCCFA